MPTYNQPVVVLSSALEVVYGLTRAQRSVEVDLGTLQVDYLLARTQRHVQLVGAIEVVTSTPLVGVEFGADAEILVETAGQITVTTTPVTPPAGFEGPIPTVVTPSTLPFLLDRFGRPV